jgi:hypothetical protein
MPFTVSWDRTVTPSQMLIIWEENLEWQKLYRLSVTTGVKDLQDNRMSEEAVYYLYIDGPSSRPPSLDLVTFIPDQNEAIVLFDKVTPSNGTDSNPILETSGADEVQDLFYFDYYFTLAEEAELPFFQLLENYLINPQNSCILVVYKNFQVFNPGETIDTAAAPKPTPSATQTVVRLITSVTDKYDSSGTVEFQVFKELTDSLGNSMVKNWRVELFDEDN